MKQPQVINLDSDVVLAFDGDSVINDSTQAFLGTGVVWAGLDIHVDIDLFELGVGGGVVSTIVNATMEYQSESDFWTIAFTQGTPTILATLTDRKKYVGKVTENAATASNMRDFKIHEFSVDNDSFEDVWMRLPYDIQISPTPKIIWYSDSIGGTPAFEALVYEGGSGTGTPATDASRITHRGPIEAV